MDIREVYNQLTVRDYTGSPSDKYAQDLETFRFHSFVQGKESDFFLLFEKAQKQGKQIALDPVFVKNMSNIMYDDIPFESLIIS